MAYTLKRAIRIISRSSDFFSKLFIVAGLLSIFLSVPPKTQLYSNELSLFDYPVFITVNSKKIPVGLGNFQNDQWQLSKSKALYLTSSGKLGTNGNIVIYGHNTDRIFSNLGSVKIGDQINIDSQNGQTLKYEIDSIKTVNPKDISVLQERNEQRITVFTCDGLFDSKRLVVSGVKI